LHSDPRMGCRCHHGYLCVMFDCNYSFNRRKRQQKQFYLVRRPRPRYDDDDGMFKMVDPVKYNLPRRLPIPPDRQNVDLEDHEFSFICFRFPGGFEWYKVESDSSRYTWPGASIPSLRGIMRTYSVLANCYIQRLRGIIYSGIPLEYSQLNAKSPNFLRIFTLHDATFHQKSRTSRHVAAASESDSIQLTVRHC
jgi:hypothetical protein